MDTKWTDQDEMTYVRGTIYLLQKHRMPPEEIYSFLMEFTEEMNELIEEINLKNALMEESQ